MRIEKEQTGVMGMNEFINDYIWIAELLLPANVERDGDIAGRGSFQGVNGLLEHSGRKVLDTVKAQVLEGFDRLALAGTGQASNKDDTWRSHMKLFSPERANALIPKLTPLIEELLTKRCDLAIRLLESNPELHRVEQPRAPRLAGMRSPLPPARFGELKLEIHRLIYKIESLGCIVKDIDLGLIDFPSTDDTGPIYLCWKFGEPAVTHWHNLDEGFSSRKAL